MTTRLNARTVLETARRFADDLSTDEQDLAESLIWDRFLGSELQAVIEDLYPQGLYPRDSSHPRGKEGEGGLLSRLFPRKPSDPVVDSYVTKKSEYLNRQIQVIDEWADRYRQMRLLDDAIYWVTPPRRDRFTLGDHLLMASEFQVLRFRTNAFLEFVEELVARIK